MPVSVFDLFKVGIGPSSSHTVGPMRIALRFVRALADAGGLESVARIEAHLYGSLALTGRGHATDRAVLLGLMGQDPETVDIAQAGAWLEAAGKAGEIRLLGRHAVPFRACDDLGHRTGQRAKMAKDAEWTAFVPSMLPYLVHQESVFLAPAAFSPLA